MPPLIAQYIGGAGTGKTRLLVETMEKVVEKLHDPHLIGYVSFTRAACDEAAARAADRFNVPLSELRNTGWFKTLHGITYRCLGVNGDQLLTDRAADRKWLQEALQIDVQGAADEMDSERLDVFDGAQSDADRALAMWAAARNRLEGLRPVWEAADECDDRTPPYDDCAAIIDRYEQAKRLDDRMDFVDLLGMFGGWRFYTDGAQRVSPIGDIPALPVWIHDEMQDSSKLLDSCFRRLIDAPGVQWVYLAADPFQSIFGWSGADHRCFSDYPTAKRRVMPKSWRCPAEILNLGEDVLRNCSDYWDRGIEPVGPGGEIDEESFGGGWVDDIDPRESWLLLARTNYQAARMARRLDEAGIPWHPTKKDGGSKWKAPARATAIKALMNLEKGAWCDGYEWQGVVERLPAKLDGEELLTRGTKSQWAQYGETDLKQWTWIQPADLAQVGGTQKLLDLIASGHWREVVDGASDYAEAVEHWGQEAVDSPGVRLGTVHSAKGLEADNVVVLTTLSKPVAAAAQSDEGADENHRLKYVAVTRAKQRLIFVKEQKTRYRWKLPV